MQMTEGIFLCVGINAFVIVITTIYCCQVANKLGKIYLTQYRYYDNVGYINIPNHDCILINSIQTHCNNLSQIYNLSICPRLCDFAKCGHRLPV